MQNWNPTRLGSPIAVSLLGADKSLCDESGNFRFEGFQASGVTFNPTFFETANSSITNPINTVLAQGEVGSGIPGLIERVTDNASCSSVSDQSKAFAWKFTTAPGHCVTANHGRTQMSTPTLPLYTKVECQYSVRWDTNRTSAKYAPLDTGVPPHDSLHDVIVWQLHQTHSQQPFEASQYGGNKPIFFLEYISGRWRFVINRLRDDGGCLCKNDKGSAYIAFDIPDSAMGMASEDYYSPLGEYVDFSFEFVLDEREPWKGGTGYMKVRVGRQLIVDYVGPTLQPLRGEDKDPRVVNPSIRFGMYFCATPFESVITRSVQDTVVMSPNVLNPFKPCSLLVRKFKFL